MSFRRLAGVLGVLAVGAVLSACAPEPNASWELPAYTEGRLLVTDPPEPSSGREADDGFGQRIRHDELGLQARWHRVPGAGALDAAAHEIVREAIAQRTAQTGLSYAPVAPPRGAGLADRACVPGSTTWPAPDVVADAALGPSGGEGVAVVCDVLAAAGPYLVQRLRVVEAAGGAIVSDTATVLYADTSADEVVTGAQLWTDAAPAELWEDTVEALRREYRSLSLAPVAPPDEAGLATMREALAQTSVAPGGELVVTIPAGFTTPELAGLGVDATREPITVGVPPDVSAELTTGVGAAIVAAVASGVAFAPPAPPAAGFDSVDCALVPCVALTYDDGPSSHTPGILDEAAARRASVTFFVVGQMVAARADVVARAVAEGHLVENHSWSHPELPGLTDPQIAAQIRDTTAVVERVTGVRPSVFRPPYGAYDDRVLDAADLAAIIWDVDTLDWRQPSDDELIARAVDEPLPGSIVLQHDIQDVTARTAPAVFDGLIDRGFTLVNLRQIFDGELPASGAWRSAR